MFSRETLENRSAFVAAAAVIVLLALIVEMDILHGFTITDLTCGQWLACAAIGSAVLWRANPSRSSYALAAAADTEGPPVLPPYKRAGRPVKGTSCGGFDWLVRARIGRGQHAMPPAGHGEVSDDVLVVRRNRQDGTRGELEQPPRDTAD